MELLKTLAFILTILYLVFGMQIAFNMAADKSGNIVNEFATSLGITNHNNWFIRIVFPIIAWPYALPKVLLRRRKICRENKQV